jgi:hypothetical protein
LSAFFNAFSTSFASNASCFISFSFNSFLSHLSHFSGFSRAFFGGKSFLASNKLKLPFKNVFISFFSSSDSFSTPQSPSPNPFLSSN